MNRRSCLVSRGSWVVPVTFLVLGASLAAQTKKPAARPLTTVRQVHDAMIIPASDALFALETSAPKNNAGWAAAKKHALTIAEAARLLAGGALARDKGQWTRYARSLADKAEAEAKSFDRRNADDIALANGDMLEVCQDCHATYRDRGRSMR